MLEEKKTTVTYKSSTKEVHGVVLDILQVTYSRDEKPLDSFTIGRDSSGKIMRKIDLILDRWSIVNDEDEQRDLQKLYDERDRLGHKVSA